MKTKLAANRQPPASAGQSRTGRSRLGLLWAVGFCGWLVACQPLPLPPGLGAQVSQVATGQTFEVEGIWGQPEITERICLEGITVPDLSQIPWGTAAKTYLEQAIAHQTVHLESDARVRDATGCRLAYVWRAGILMNERLVAQGHALVTPHPPNSKYDRRLAAAQDRARTLGLGIWNPQQPLRQLPNPD